MFDTKEQDIPGEDPSDNPQAPCSGLGEVDDLAHGLSMLSKVVWSDLPNTAQLDALADIELLRRRLDGIAIRLTGQPGVGVAANLDGFAGARGFLRSGECRLPRPEANRRALLARRVRESNAMKPVLMAMIDGRIGFAQANLIGKYSTCSEVAWAFDEAVESVFLPIAEMKDYAFFERAMRKWYEHHDTTQGDKRDRSQDAKQKVRASTTFDGMVRIDGWLPTVDGEIFTNEFERLRRHLYDLDWQEAKGRLGRKPKPDELARTADERSVAVMVMMAQRSASLGNAPMTSLPCVNVHIDYATFIAANSEFLGLPALYPAGGLSRTEMGLPVSPRTVIETLMIGHVRRVVFGPDGEILDFGRKNRFFDGGLREAVMTQNQTCEEEGCDVPARFCEIDHCQSWNDLGETALHNGRPRCRFHNGWKGSRSVEPILDTETQTLAFHVSPNSLYPRPKRKPRPGPNDAQARSSRPSATSKPPQPEPRQQTNRDQQ